MRVGEASQLKFKDHDFEKRTVRVVPETGSRARELRLSEGVLHAERRLQQVSKEPASVPANSKALFGEDTRLSRSDKEQPVIPKRPLAHVPAF